MSYQEPDDGWGSVRGQDRPSRALKPPSKNTEGMPRHLYPNPSGDRPMQKERCGGSLADRGCYQFFVPSDFNHSSGLCVRCAQKMALEYGVDYSFCGYITSVRAHNLKWFVEKVPVLAEFSDTIQVRMVLHAIGIKITSPTQDEDEGAGWLRESVKCIAHSHKVMAGAMKLSQATAEVSQGVRVI